MATVLLCSEPFITTAAREAVAAGMPDLSRVMVSLDLGRATNPAGAGEVVAAALSALTGAAEAEAALGVAASLSVIDRRCPSNPAPEAW